MAIGRAGPAQIARLGGRVAVKNFDGQRVAVAVSPAIDAEKFISGEGHPTASIGRFIAGVDCAIIMNPKVWEASGHVGGFADPMRKCPGCGHFVRADQLWDVLATGCKWLTTSLTILQYPQRGARGAQAEDQRDRGRLQVGWQVDVWTGLAGCVRAAAWPFCSSLPPFP